MKKIVFILSVFIFFNACSSATEETGNTAAVNIAANSNTDPANAPQMVQLEGVDPNAFNANSSDIRVVNRDTSNVKTPFGPLPAPDESEFKTDGRKDGSFAETRTFKNHPQLLKIEKVTLGKDVSLKVYLKNGKSFNVTEEQVPNFRIAAAQTILIAIGQAPKMPDQPAQTTKSEEKDDKDEDGKQ